MLRYLEYCSKVGVKDKTNQGVCCCRDRMIVGLQLPMNAISVYRH